MKKGAILRSIKELYRYDVRATDGHIGKVDDFCFQDDTWLVKYMVVDVGGWLSYRRVLISFTSLKKPDWSERVFPVKLTKEMVKSSPPLDENRPISRVYEDELSEHYGWPDFSPVKIRIASMEARKESILRSVKEVLGYHINSTDGEVGHVGDFIIDDSKWLIQYMVVDTRNILPGKEVLVSVNWIEKVSWAESKVYLDITEEELRGAPDFDYSTPVNREYEMRLYDYYGRPFNENEL
ncbi:PRC-barrel domain containing protein [Candidatus Poribacteria bacterium]|nr:PRC-barrel domain containing protein [Candidatus Poribacteria bacterium]